MKEIVYLDTELVNSILAQIDQGIITDYAQHDDTQKSLSSGTRDSSGKSATLAFNASGGSGWLPGVNIGLSGNIGGKSDAMSLDSETLLEGHKDILNKSFHDYSLVLLLEKLKSGNLLMSNQDELHEGDLYFGEGPFTFFDFELLSNALNPDALETFMLYEDDQSIKNVEEAENIIKKAKGTKQDPTLIKEAKNMVEKRKELSPILNLYSTLDILSSYSSKILGGHSIIKSETNIGLVKKEYLRESPESLSFRGNNGKNIKFLARIIRKKDEVYDGTGLETISPDQLHEVPNFMLDIVLGSFNIIKSGDLLVTPIAIYFE
ncbi:hypothetical protein VL05_18980 [Bacillus stratosphericus]|uniref:DUF6414 family protein n=1 Tax=Bacillus TaxID=1386 RepID=UPI00064E7CEE|nr:MULTISPECIES: hypothetical protein [Bacillus]KMK98182.1 hypothetical protein VL05_18980 [Bacillus stratosphericus]KML49864.1 hypothetical protein VL17_14975 [Bacillus stratosphericus]MCL7872265.1 hypothetical protein [Bacillus altitudinis]MDJ0285334.1 hypothetical protein [Bacillus altitudinis]WQH40100.1 hypothetical protein U2873_06220 [Bacillus altitudinis]